MVRRGVPDTDFEQLVEIVTKACGCKTNEKDLGGISIAQKKQVYEGEWCKDAPRSGYIAELVLPAKAGASASNATHLPEVRLLETAAKWRRLDSKTPTVS